MHLVPCNQGQCRMLSRKHKFTNESLVSLKQLTRSIVYTHNQNADLKLYSRILAEASISCLFFESQVINHCSVRRQASCSYLPCPWFLKSRYHISRSWEKLCLDRIPDLDLQLIVHGGTVLRTADCGKWCYYCKSASILVYCGLLV